MVRAAFVALLLASAAVGADVYRWTDEAGVTHFGDRRPAGQAATEVSPAPAAPAGDPAQAAARVEALRKDIEARAAAREEARSKAAEERQASARMAQECDQARAELAAMESARRINRPDGTTVYGDERLGLMDELRRSIAEHCR